MPPRPYGTPDKALNATISEKWRLAAVLEDREIWVGKQLLTARGWRGKVRDDSDGSVYEVGEDGDRGCAGEVGR